MLWTVWCHVQVNGVPELNSAVYEIGGRGGPPTFACFLKKTTHLGISKSHRSMTLGISVFNVIVAIRSWPVVNFGFIISVPSTQFLHKMNEFILLSLYNTFRPLSPFALILLRFPFAIVFPFIGQCLQFLQLLGGRCE